MNPRQLLAAIVLALLAALSGWAVWQLRERDTPPELLGPPRSDYFVEEFELITFDAAGNESFWVRGPRLSRHPELGTLDIEQPRLGMPGGDQRWMGRADRGWVSADADRLRLLGAVDLRSVPAAGEPATRLLTDAIDLLADVRRAETDAAVTVEGPGSILRGRGLRADLASRDVELLAEVTGRYEPIRR